MGGNFSTKKEAFLVTYEKALAHRHAIDTERRMADLETERELRNMEIRRREYAAALDNKLRAADAAVVEARAALLANVQDAPER